MINAIRSSLFCDKVENDERGASYIGLQGDVLRADSQPGLIHSWLALLVEVDRKASAGAIKLETEGYSEAFPSTVPAGLTLTATAFPLIIPVLAEGPLKVSVRNDAGSKPLRVSWALRFADGAEVLDSSAGEEFLTAAKDTAEHLRQGFAQKAQPNF